MNKDDPVIKIINVEHKCATFCVTDTVVGLHISSSELYIRLQHRDSKLYYMHEVFNNNLFEMKLCFC